MPTELEGLDSPNKLIEFRKIKTGEKSGKVPNKTPIRIRIPLRDWKAKRFPMDEDYMRGEARRQGLNPDKDWTRLQELEVRTLSDKIVGDNGVVFIERALYTGRGRLCGSRANDPKAYQSIDVAAYARDKKIVELNEPKEVDCTTRCPLWPKPGKKSDCRWRCIATFQLPHLPVYPAPCRFRSTSLNTIKALITSLRFISQATNGVIMGIPLWLTQSLLDTHDAEGELRRIPVLHIEFKGSIQELRTHALREMESRNRLKAAADGEIFDTQPISFVDDSDLSEIEPIVESASAEGESEEEELKEIEQNQENREMDQRSQIALHYKKLGWPAARQRLLEDKHSGDLSKILDELETLNPEFNPSPGEPGPNEADGDDVDEDFLNDDFFDE